MSGLENKIIMQNWEEIERGYGTRPEGCSLHKTETDCQKFIDNYWDKLPNKLPSLYDRPSGTTYHIIVSDNLIQQLKTSEYGIRISSGQESELIANREIIL